jgi:hypothetical protein
MANFPLFLSEIDPTFMELRAINVGKLPNDIIDLLDRCKKCLMPYYADTLLYDDLEHVISEQRKMRGDEAGK